MTEWKTEIVPKTYYGIDGFSVMMTETLSEKECEERSWTYSDEYDCDVKTEPKARVEEVWFPTRCRQETRVHVR